MRSGFRWLALLAVLSSSACGSPAQTTPLSAETGVPQSTLAPVGPPGATPQTTSAPQIADAAPTIGGCPVFPVNNIWNTPVNRAPVDPNSARYIASIGADRGLHADFGAGLYDGGPIGIPFVVVPQTQPPVPINFTAYGDESDPGPYPIPPDAPIEGGNRPIAENDGDRHVLVVQAGSCKLYELYRSFPNPNGSWDGESGAVFDLRSNALRPDGWTSADAAGLPILPGLVRYDEVAAGEIRHAIRFTVQRTRDTYRWPARHFASSSDSLDYPPMGQRFRLKASFDITPFSPNVQVILRAMQTYGLILADNGSNWFISGAPDERWDNDLLTELGQVTGSQFEAVDVATWQAEPNSGRVIDSLAPQDQKTVEPGGAAQNSTLSYKIKIVGDNQSISLSDPLPAGISFVAGSLITTPASPPAVYDSALNRITWSGALPDTLVLAIRFQVQVTTAELRVIENVATITHGSSNRVVRASFVSNPLQIALPLIQR